MGFEAPAEFNYMNKPFREGCVKGLESRRLSPVSSSRGGQVLLQAHVKQLFGCGCRSVLARVSCSLQGRRTLSPHHRCHATSPIRFDDGRWRRRRRRPCARRSVRRVVGDGGFGQRRVDHCLPTVAQATGHNQGAGASSLALAIGGAQLLRCNTTSCGPSTTCLGCGPVETLLGTGLEQ